MKSSASGVFILQDAAAANGDGASFTMDSFEKLAIQITGTYSAKVHIEATMDGTNWVEIAATDLGSTSPSTKTKTINSAAGLYAVDLLGGFTSVRTRISDYASGAVTVRVNGHN